MAEHTVKVYSTPTCPWCHKAKDWLKEHNIEFTDYDVSSDQEAQADMIEKSGQRGVPVIDIDGNIIVGFDEDEMKKQLDIKDDAAQAA